MKIYMKGVSEVSKKLSQLVSKYAVDVLGLVEVEKEVAQRFCNMFIEKLQEEQPGEYWTFCISDELGQGMGGTEVAVLFVRSSCTGCQRDAICREEPATKNGKPGPSKKDPASGGKPGSSKQDAALGDKSPGPSVFAVEVPDAGERRKGFVVTLDFIWARMTVVLVHTTGFQAAKLPIIEAEIKQIAKHIGTLDNFKKRGVIVLAGDFNHSSTTEATCAFPALRVIQEPPRDCLTFVCKSGKHDLPRQTNMSVGDPHTYDFILFDERILEVDVGTDFQTGRSLQVVPYRDMTFSDGRPLTDHTMIMADCPLVVADNGGGSEGAVPPEPPTPGPPNSKSKSQRSSSSKKPHSRELESVVDGMQKLNFKSP